MKRPTITKQQAVAALVELRIRDNNIERERWQEQHDLLEQEYYAEMHALLTDPVRFAFARDAKDKDGEPCLSMDLDGEITLQIDDDEGIKVARGNLRASYKRCPEYLNPSTLTQEYEDRLTGCTPEALLSVPENVATFRALLNGLQLLPESYESMNQ